MADGQQIALDEKPVRTPAGDFLRVRNGGVAAAIAHEWEAQAERVNPMAMPLTRIANASIDGARQNRPAVIDGVVAYIGSDLICYRAEGPDDLQARQAAAWDPLLDWLNDAIGVRLNVTQGIVHVSQDPVAVETVTDRIADYDEFVLACLHIATTLTGSLVIGLALVEGWLSADQAWGAANVDETWQAEKWGADEEAEARAVSQLAEIRSARRYLDLHLVTKEMQE